MILLTSCRLSVTIEDMYIERVPNRKSPPAVLLRESYREGGKVRKRTLANLSKWPDDLVRGLRILLKGGVALKSMDDAFEILRARPHGHVAAVLGTARALGLERLLDRRPSRMRSLALAMIAARVLDPRSKLATARGLRLRDAGRHAGRGDSARRDATAEELYAAMDWLLQAPAAHRTDTWRPEARRGRITRALRPDLGVLRGREVPAGQARLLPGRQARQASDRLRPALRPRGPSGGRRGLRGQHGGPRRRGRPGREAHRALLAVPGRPGRRPGDADRRPHPRGCRAGGAALDHRAAGRRRSASWPSGGDLQLSIFDDPGPRRDLRARSSIRTSGWSSAATRCWRPSGPASARRCWQATEAKLELVVRATTRENRPLRGDEGHRRARRPRPARPQGRQALHDHRDRGRLLVRARRGEASPRRRRSTAST